MSSVGLKSSEGKGVWIGVEDIAEIVRIIDKKPDAPVSGIFWNDFDPLDCLPQKEEKKRVLPVWLIYKIKEGERSRSELFLLQFIEIWVGARQVESFRKALRDFLFVFTGKRFQGKSIHEMRVMWDWYRYVWWKWSGFLIKSLDESRGLDVDQGKIDGKIEALIDDEMIRFRSFGSNEVLGELSLDPRLSLLLEKIDASGQRKWAKEIVGNIWEKVRKAETKRRASGWAKDLSGMLFTTLSEHEIVLSWALRCDLEQKKELLRKLLLDPGIFHSFALLFDPCLLEVYLEEKEEAIELAVFLFERLVNEIRGTYRLKRAYPYDVRECSGGLNEELEFRGEKSVVRFCNEREGVGGVAFPVWRNTELYPRVSLKKIKIEHQEKVELTEDLILIATRPTIAPQLDRLTSFLSSLVRLYLFTTPVVVTKDVLNYVFDKRKEELKEFLKAVFTLCLLKTGCLGLTTKFIDLFYNELKPLFKLTETNDHPSVTPLEFIKTLILHKLPLRFAYFKIYIKDDRLAVVTLENLVRKFVKRRISEGRTQAQEKYTRAREILKSAIKGLYQTYIHRELSNNVPSFFIDRLDERLKKEEVVDEFLKWHYDREDKKRRSGNPEEKKEKSGEILRKISRLASGYPDKDICKIYRYLKKLELWKTAYDDVYAKKKVISEDLSYLDQEEDHPGKRSRIRTFKVKGLKRERDLHRILKNLKDLLKKDQIKRKLSSEILDELQLIITSLSNTATARENLIHDTITPRIYDVQNMIDAKMKIDLETASEKAKEMLISLIKEYLAHVLKQEFYKFYQEKGLAPMTCYWTLLTKAKQLHGKRLKELTLEELVKTVIEACKIMGKRKLASGRFSSLEGKDLIPQASHPASDPTPVCDKKEGLVDPEPSFPIRKKLK
ncbi:MAG: hypothetical protein QXO20_06820 [Candidatus Bathyarchaeia archaeon]